MFRNDSAGELKRRQRISPVIFFVAIWAGLVIAAVPIVSNADKILPYVLPQSSNFFASQPGRTESASQAVGVESASQLERAGSASQPEGTESASSIAQALSDVMSLLIGVPVALAGSIVAVLLAHSSNSISQIVGEIEVKRNKREVKEVLLRFLDGRYRGLVQPHDAVHRAYLNLMVAGRELALQFAEDIEQNYQLNSNYEYHPGANFISLRSNEPGLSHDFCSKADRFAVAAEELDQAVLERIYSNLGRDDCLDGVGISFKNAEMHWEKAKEELRRIGPPANDEPLFSLITWRELNDIRKRKLGRSGVASRMFFLLDSLFRSAIGSERTIVNKSEIDLDAAVIQIREGVQSTAWAPDLARSDVRRHLASDLFKVVGRLYLVVSPERQVLQSEVLAKLSFAEQKDKVDQSFKGYDDYLDFSSRTREEDDEFIGGEDETDLNDQSMGALEAQELKSIEHLHYEYIKRFESEADAINVGSSILAAIYDSLPTASEITKLLSREVINRSELIDEGLSEDEVSRIVAVFVQQMLDFKKRTPDQYRPKAVQLDVVQLPDLRDIPFPETSDVVELLRETGKIGLRAESTR